MAEARHGVSCLLVAVASSAAAGFVFGEAASFAVDPPLMDNAAFLDSTAVAAKRAGPTGVAVVMACLIFTSVLLSLGTAFLLASLVMTLMIKAGVGFRWLVEVTTGAALAAAAVTTGVLVGILPTWICVVAQSALVLIVYSFSNINDMTTALLIIFTTLYLTITYGQMGVLLGCLCLILTLCTLYAFRRAMKKRKMVRSNQQRESKLLERIFFYSVVVGVLGFLVGSGGRNTGGSSETEVISMMRSVLWVGYLSAGLLGAGLSTVAMVGLGPEMAGKVSAGTSLTITISLRAILLSSLGARGRTAATLGAVAAAGVSLGAASVAAKQTFNSRDLTLTVVGAVTAGALLALKGVALRASVLTTTELLTLVLVALVSFVMGAPKSPFHTPVNLRRGLMTGTELIKGIGMETVAAAAAPIGAGALGAAVLGTAALGTLGTVGVVVAISLALGSALTGMTGKVEVTTNNHMN